MATMLRLESHVLLGTRPDQAVAMDESRLPFEGAGAAIASSGDAVIAIWGEAAAICFAANALIESRHK